MYSINDPYNNADLGGPAIQIPNSRFQVFAPGLGAAGTIRKIVVYKGSEPLVMSSSGVFRKGQWILDYGINGVVDRRFQFGMGTDVPIVGTSFLTDLEFFIHEGVTVHQQGQKSLCRVYCPQ